MRKISDDSKAATIVIIVTASVLILLLIVVLYMNFRAAPTVRHVTVNESVSSWQAFEVTSESTDLISAAEGTVFYGADPARARIVASFVIDPLDWGGVHFNFPLGWQIDEVNSSYPEEQTEVGPDSVASIWTSGEENGQSEHRLVIGWHQEYDASPHGGGHGTVIIDLSHPGEPPDSALEFAVAVGSEIRNGYRIQGPDYIRVNQDGITEGD